MPPASRAFFLFLSRLNHNKARPTCLRIRITQQRYTYSQLVPPKPSPPSRTSPRPQAAASPPDAEPTPSERTKHGIPQSQWRELSWPSRFYHYRTSLYPSFLRKAPRLRRSLYTYLLILFPALFFWVHRPFETFTVRGISMSPTLNAVAGERDHVLVQKWNVNAGRLQRRSEEEREEKGELSNGRFERGQLVVFWCPHRRGEVAVKRVVGVPGDRVRPLPEYERRRTRGDDDDEEEEEEEEYSVLVPYNHLWVEGDAGEFGKSVDSNWFGPISQELVVGEVKLIWSPWWNVLGANSVDWGRGVWPARAQGRVDENVAWRSAANPDALHRFETFESGRVVKMLAWVKARPDIIFENFVGNEKMRRVYTEVYVVSRKVMVNAQSDPEHRRLARDLVEAMEVIVPRDVWLGKKSVVEKKVRARGVPKKEEPKHNMSHFRLLKDDES